MKGEKMELDKTGGKKVRHLVFGVLGTVLLQLLVKIGTSVSGGGPKGTKAKKRKWSSQEKKGGPRGEGGYRGEFTEPKTLGGGKVGGPTG